MYIYPTMLTHFLSDEFHYTSSINFPSSLHYNCNIADMTHNSSDNELKVQANALEFIEDVTTNADEVQRMVLANILSRNKDVEYLQRHGLNRCTDSKTFKKMIPMITYEDIIPDIQRIANGDTSQILCSDPISEFLTSSGTSGGKRKLIPTTDEELPRKGFFLSIMKPIMDKFVPNLSKGKGMYFLFMKPQARTPGGLLAQPVITSFYKSSFFQNMSSDAYANYTSPPETILCPDFHQSMYAQMLCGLCQNTQVLFSGALFAYGFIRAVKFLEKNWEVLCHDISTGTLNSQITDSSVRAAVMKILTMNPSLADLIRTECKKSSWKGIIPRLWPNIKYIDVIVTGTMSQYIPTVDYYSNGLPLVCTTYASSECFFGLNLHPLSKPSEVSYTLLPNMAYFEFMPANLSFGLESKASNVESVVKERTEEKLVDLVDVKLGEEYELVVTTYTGLYRYQVGDILRVAGFKNKAPHFNFVCRKNVALSIDTDKTDEIELHNAVNKAAEHLVQFQASVLDYSSYVDTSTIPGHYVLFWEMNKNDTSTIPRSTFDDCCITAEESLNSVYRQGRVSDKSIGPLEIRIVQKGTFDEIMDCAIAQLGASANQYKTPRCVKYPPIIELLNSRVLSRHFSPRCPKWVPDHMQLFTTT